MDKPAQNNQQPGRKHSRNADKIQKGFTAAYPTQSSIPFKFQSSIIPESEKKGFNSQARRFYHKKDDNPGPGFYNVIHQSPVSNSVSLSKKGTCTFPSMCARMDTIISKYPAANAYTLPSRFVSKKDFSNSCSSMFQLPSFAKVLKFETPAPNHYNGESPAQVLVPSKHAINVYDIKGITLPGHNDEDKEKEGKHWLIFSPQASVSYCKQKNNVSARAGFMSKTQRGLFTIAERGPAPEKVIRTWGNAYVNVSPEEHGLQNGFHSELNTWEKTGRYYNVNESLVKKSPNILMSCFKSKTSRGLKLTSTGPGPGYYNPNDHIKIPKKTLIPRNPILNFSASPLPLPPKPSLPGPGQYEIVDYVGPPKHFISSASFVSNTSRWTMAPSQPGLPGPATYKPEFPGKQSFLYNEDKKWIPVL